MPEPIAATELLTGSMLVPNEVYLKFTDLSILEVLSKDTGYSYEELIRTAIRFLYQNKEIVFNKEVTDAT